MLIYCCNSRAEALHNLRHSIRRGSPHMCPLVTSGTYYIHRGTHTLGADAGCPSLTCATCGMLATCFHARTDATVPISSGGSHQPNQSNHLCPSLRVLRWPSGKTLFLFFCSFFFGFSHHALDITNVIRFDIDGTYYLGLWSVAQHGPVTRLPSGHGSQTFAGRQRLGRTAGLPLPNWRSFFALRNW